MKRRERREVRALVLRVLVLDVYGFVDSFGGMHSTSVLNFIFFLLESPPQPLLYEGKKNKKSVLVVDWIFFILFNVNNNSQFEDVLLLFSDLMSSIASYNYLLYKITDV